MKHIPGADAIEIVRLQGGDDPEYLAMVAEELQGAEVAMLVAQLRADAGLTQAELAKLVGTTQPVIARLENWEYSGHSLTMLRRIATALGKTLKISVVEAVDAKPAGKGKRKTA